MSNSSDSAASEVSSSTPTALVRSAQQREPSRLNTRLWWLSGICVLVALALLLTSFRTQGVSIVLHFKEGHGLKPGDTLRYRGIDLGRVSSVKLNSAMDGVDVSVLLETSNQAIAVEDSQFWIQRAKLSLGNVSGIDTVLGAKYIGVIPGSSHERRFEFTGLETPLLMTEGDDSEIRIRFPAGEGLDVGDPIKYRGIKVGEVVGIQLEKDLQSVMVNVRLVGEAKKLARLGTQFWIERPRLDLTEIRGIDTVIAGKYIALQPTSNEGPLATSFDGMSEPPPLPRREGSLEIELDSPQRMGIVRGAPVIYRGLEVGRVANVGLARDGATVKISAVIDADYAELVREKSRWWAVGGVDVDAGLGGFRVSIESISTWIRGGVAFATPESDSGKPAVTGYRFVLESKPKEEWLGWQPRIATGSTARSASGLPHPLALRVLANWKTSMLGIPKRHSEKSWGLVIDDGTLIVPSALLKAANEAGSQVTIEFAGNSFAISSPQTKTVGSVSSIKLPIELPEAAAVDRWKHDLLGWPAMPKLLQIYNPELSEPIAIDNTRLEQTENALRIAPGVGLSPTLVGSPVVDATNGNVIGLLIKTDKDWLIAKLP